MKLVSFRKDGRDALGAVTGSGVVDLTVAGLPATMKALLKAGDVVMALARQAAEKAELVHLLKDVELLPPVTNPGKILAIGLNYRDHIEETGLPVPEVQLWFNKQIDAIAGPSDDIIIPSAAPDMVDFEAELCVVIGKHCRHVPKERAHEVIAGYMCGNDVSARDWQLASPTFIMGKSFVSHAPTGPWLVTKDEIENPHELNIRCELNGEEVQNSNTEHLVFDIYDQIEHLTKAFPLNPGDIIFTGTPGGVGMARDPQLYMKPGDNIVVEIDGLGRLENACVAEEVTTIIQ